MIRNKDEAFTLAEVLITLAVIGVVAAMTIPALMNNTQNQEFKTAYKKAFSVASQSWQQCANDNELVYRSSWGDNVAGETNFLAFKNRFKVAVDCTDGSTFKCWVDADKFWNAPNNGALAFIDSSGMAWSRQSSASGGNGDGDTILVDTNGNKGPNKFGKDRFPLTPIVPPLFTGSTPGIPTKIVPWGPIDYINADAMNCPYGSCYYKSWLVN